MKTILCIAVLLTPSLCCCQQDTVVLSPRVGTVIDTEEREYFGLFPDVDELLTAIVLSTQDTTRFILRSESAQTHNLKDTIIDAYAIRMLASWIKDFERYRYAMRSASDFDDIQRKYYYIIERSLVHPYNRPRDLLLTIEYSNRREAEGSLLFCNDYMLIIDPDPKHSLFNDAVPINIDAINRIEYQEKEWSTAFLSIATGLAAGLASAYAVWPGTHENSVEQSSHNDHFFDTLLGIVTFLTVTSMTAILTSVITDAATTYTVARPSSGSVRIRIPDIFHQRQFFSRGLPPELKVELLGNR